MAIPNSMKTHATFTLAAANKSPTTPRSMMCLCNARVGLAELRFRCCEDSRVFYARQYTGTREFASGVIKFLESRASHGIHCIADLADQATPGVGYTPHLVICL